ncbi:MAG: magnesium/cobalt transporter CorA [Deltaproteobacteria bacterium]|nr:magnesium/cobalt transporter CorA [Candidatus Zymogenaceae bacterium]
MTRIIKKVSLKTGLPPGSLVHIGEETAKKTTISIIDYNQESFTETPDATVADCRSCMKTDTVTWVNVSGIHEVPILEEIGAAFDLHPLVMEDIMNTTQRPKMEAYERYIYIVMKMVYEDEKADEIIEEQISIILGDSYVISFQENGKDVFDKIRQRIKKAGGLIRKSGADFLAYALIDAVVDGYFNIVERFEEMIEFLEDRIITDPSRENLSVIHDTKIETIMLRKSISPLREMIGFLERGESPLIKRDTVIYLRDVYDHTIRLIETVETIRDMLSGMLDIYLTNVSNRMNEIMKVLTIITTIFIPLSFITGVYGMNFRDMPGLANPMGFWATIGLMVVIVMFMLLFFRRKRWM